MNMKEAIKKYCTSLGLDTVGFMECKRFDELVPYFEYRKELGVENEFEEKDSEKRVNPKELMNNGRTIISIAFPYLYIINNYNQIYFSKYTYGNDYHKVVAQYLEKVCHFINELGGEAMYFVDSNPLPERYIAWKSGIGFIGKNNMLITEKYGSYVFLGEIITNLELEADEQIENKCGECEICIKACPSKAIKQRKENDIGYVNNSNVCLSYITQKKDIEDLWFDKFKGRMFGCDTCQDVCPYNKKAQFSSIEEFKPKLFAQQVQLEELLKIDNKTFIEKYKQLSCGWRGKNILQRNAFINAANLQKMNLIDVKDISSPYVKEYYYRLLKHFKL
ncbi:MAG: tRNA epoxyqueuosine(34) reductase QueG [Bacillota bacterium]|nr:tRNA epoxyqueuosine(34) reductase QueG [Bacillota bacterium]